MRRGWKAVHEVWEVVHEGGGGWKAVNEVWEVVHKVGVEGSPCDGGGSP